MFRRSGHADKSMRRSRIYSHFRADFQPDPSQPGRRWLWWSRRLGGLAGHRLEGRVMAIFKPVTLITGASSGIGAALAGVFAQHGHDIVMVARREAQLRAVADDIEDAGYQRPHVVPIDLGRSDAAARIAHDLVSHGF